MSNSSSTTNKSHPKPNQNSPKLKPSFTNRSSRTTCFASRLQDWEERNQLQVTLRKTMMLLNRWRLTTICCWRSLSCTGDGTKSWKESARTNKRRIWKVRLTMRNLLIKCFVWTHRQRVNRRWSSNWTCNCPKKSNNSRHASTSSKSLKPHKKPLNRALTILPRNWKLFNRSTKTYASKSKLSPSPFKSTFQKLSLNAENTLQSYSSMNRKLLTWKTNWDSSRLSWIQELRRMISC